MQIQAIRSSLGIQKKATNFKPDKVQKYIQNSKLFCLPVYKKDLTKMEYFTNENENVNWVKVFTNPKAKELYTKAQALLKEPETSFEKIEKAGKLFVEMGEYTLIDLDAEEKLDNFVKAKMP